MNYSSGEEILIGDEVIADTSDGVVVCVIETQQFSDDYAEGWAYLEKGCLVENEAMGLVHYPESNEDLILIKRKL